MVTLLIPTHNRNSYLSRCLSYLRNSEIACSILVVDSSDDPTFFLNERIISSFSARFRINQLDCRRMEFGEKLIYALEMIKSPFVTVCGDDDFVVPSTVSECAYFLQENEEYSHAHGRILTFWEQDSISAPIRLLREYRQISNENEAFERLVSHFSDYTNNFYSVHRTHLLLRYYRDASELSIGRGLKERLIAAYDIAAGKRKMVSGLFMLRQKGLTGVDENGRRTLNDDPADEKYFEQISFGQEKYFNVLRGLFFDQLSLTDSQVNQIMVFVQMDFERWKANKTRKAVVGLRSHPVLTIPRQAYRSARDFIDTSAVLSTLRVADRNAFENAKNAICDFYASTKFR